MNSRKSLCNQEKISNTVSRSDGDEEAFESRGGGYGYLGAVGRNDQYERRKGDRDTCARCWQSVMGSRS